MKTKMQIQEDSFALMKKLVELTKGNPLVYIDLSPDEFVKDFDWDTDYYFLIYNNLKEKGLITNQGITHKGREFVQEYKQNPESATEHFLPVNIINIRHVAQSNIQVGNQNTANMQVVGEPTQQAYQELIPLLHQFLQELDDEREEKAEMEAQLQTLTAQLKSPKPQSKILNWTLQTMKEVIVGVGKEALKDASLYQKVIQHLESIL